MLKVDTEYLDNRQVKLTVSVEPERLQKEMKSAAGRISAKVNIPGFRKGKAPYPIIERFVGDEYIYEEALEPFSQDVYKEALDTAGIEPYAPGNLEEMTRDPLVLTFTVPLHPEVDLGKYRDVRVPYEATEVTDHDVEHAIDHMLDDQATLEHVDRAVDWEDVAALDVKGEYIDKPKGKKKSAKAEQEEAAPEAEPEDTSFIDRKGVRVLIGKKATYPVPGFPAEIIGMSAGDERSFDVKLPAKSEDIAEDMLGRTIHFEVKCSEVFKRDVPALDDDFAQSVGDYTDLADLKTKVRAELQRDAEYAARSSYTARVFDELFDTGIVKVNYPPVIIEEQIDEMVEDFERQLKRQGMNLEDYLSLNNVDKDQLRDDFRDTAEQQVKRGLVLGKLVEEENLAVTDEEVEDEIQTQLLSFGAQAPLARQLYSAPEVRRNLASRRLTDKGLERLSQIARGEAPPLDAAPSEPSEAEAAAKTEEKPKTRKKSASGKKKEAAAESE